MIKSTVPGTKKGLRGDCPLRGMEGAAEAPPCRRPLRRSATETGVFREFAEFEKQLIQPQRKRSPLFRHVTRRQRIFSLLTFILELVFFATPSFSTVRKKQRAPEGAADFPPRTSAPSGLPRLLMVHDRWSVLLHNGLAGATRGCTVIWNQVRHSPVRASRRYWNCGRKWGCMLP